jgi:hypothetical protein
METEKVFKTKTGYCHILPDKIVFTRDGIIGNLASTVSGNHIYQSIIIYLAAVGFLTYLLINNYTEKNYVIVGLDAGLIAVLLYYIVRAFGYSVAPVIERSSIQHIVYKKAVPMLTRSSFEIHFTNEKGRTKKRLVFLPGSLTNSESIANEALTIMRSEHLIND